MDDERITLRTHLFRDVNPDAACPVCGAPSWAHDPGQVVLHSLTIIPPDSLDAAWAEAEAALHPGEYLSGFSRYDEGLPWAAQARSGPGGRHNIVTEPFDYHGHCSAFGPTPAAALRALAAKLREVGR